MVDDGHTNLTYLDASAYPSSMSQLETLCVPVGHSPLVDGLCDHMQVDDPNDIHLPNLNEPFSQSAVDVRI